MKIAVLSGKGGTGKTIVSTSLAYSLNGSQYIDCDVEEPNGAIFLKPKIEETFSVNVPVPKINESECIKCGNCAHSCQFNSLAVLKDRVLVFPELCHHCGACLIACSRNALYEVERNIGIVEQDREANFVHGKLNTGEPLSTPVIDKLKSRVKNNKPVILDCPPGTSCTVIHSVENCDYCILVAEPTPFGLHDLKIVVHLMEIMDMPFGVIINKADGNRSILEFCRTKKIQVLMEIPYSREIAEIYSRGRLPLENDPSKKKEFMELYKRITGGKDK